MSRELLTITSRITLNDGESLADKDVLVPANFVYDTQLGAIVVLGKGCAIRNVRLFTYVPEFLESWMDDPLVPVSGVGIPWNMCGIRANAAKGLVLENVHVEGFPRSGFSGYACDDVTLRRVSATRCFNGYNFAYVDRTNKRVKVDGMEVYDTWGPGPNVWPGVGGAPSVKRPGYFMGGDGFTGYFEDFSFNHLRFHGEQYSSFKIVRSKRGYVVNLKGNEFFIQGTVSRTSNPDGQTDGSEDILVKGFDIDKNYGAGEVTDDGNGVQISWNVTGCSLLDGRIRGDGKNGHGVEASGDCEVDIRGCEIGGFNLVRGGSLAYGLHAHDGSTFNADVLTANTFPDQQRLLLTN